MACTKRWASDNGSWCIFCFSHMWLLLATILNTGVPYPLHSITHYRWRASSHVLYNQPQNHLLLRCVDMWLTFWLIQLRKTHTSIGFSKLNMVGVSVGVDVRRFAAQITETKFEKTTVRYAFCASLPPYESVGTSWRDWPVWGKTP